jgi:flagellar biosynthesis protein FlhF
MQVKKYSADTLQEALDAVKAELGPEAVILETKVKKKQRLPWFRQKSPKVEVTAAISERQEVRKRNLETRIKDVDAYKQASAAVQKKMIDRYTQSQMQQAHHTEDVVDIQNKVNPSLLSERSKTRERRYIDIPDDAPDGTDEVTSIRREIEVLQEAMKSLKEQRTQQMNLEEQILRPSAVFSTFGEVFKESLYQDAFDQLVVQGVDRRIALELVKEVASQGLNLEPDGLMELLAMSLMQHFKTRSFWEALDEKGVFLMLGASGVGKTLSIAKLAAKIQQGTQKKVGLIALERQSQDAFRSLSTYARLLQVPFRSAVTREELEAALHDFSGPCDVVLIDTWAICGAGDPRARELMSVVGSFPCQALAVCSAHTRDVELLSQWKGMSAFRPVGMIFTKLDEARIHGSLLNVSIRAQVPSFFFGIGEKIPEDLEEASPERLASLLLNL